MRKARTRVLAALLCPVLLLASCATSQKLTSPTSETSVSDADSPMRERETGVPSEAWTYYETYYGRKTAERLLPDESGPNNQKGMDPQETESEETDDGTTLGDVAVGTLKVLGLILAVALGAAMGLGSAGGSFR